MKSYEEVEVEEEVWEVWEVWEVEVWEVCEVEVWEVVGVSVSGVMDMGCILRLVITGLQAEYRAAGDSDCGLCHGAQEAQESEGRQC
jgi:hypothetical protein